MVLDSGGTLTTDAEQTKRVIFGGKKMARRRFQLGSLFQRGKNPKVWVARWWEEIINPDGSIGRRRRAEVPRYSCRTLLTLTCGGSPDKTSQSN